MITVNDILITPTIFPDGTSQVWKLPETLLNEIAVDVTWEFHAEGEFMHLAQLASLLHQKNIRTNLFIPYLPYARQDKLISNDQTFALRPFLRLLKSLDFCEVYFLDVHSEVATDNYFGFTNFEPVEFIHSATVATVPDLLCFPDKGARNKYSVNYVETPHVYANKIRNQDTGEITGLEVIGHVKEAVVLIVDDICDGGMTFIKLAEKLYEKGAKEVHLYVTHGLFTKGTKALRDAGIKRIFTRHGEYHELSNSSI